MWVVSGDYKLAHDPTCAPYHDRGFALSDHADWYGLNAAIEASDPQEVWVTHGYRDDVRWLNERGRPARAIETRFSGEAGAETADAASAETAGVSPSDDGLRGA